MKVLWLEVNQRLAFYFYPASLTFFPPSSSLWWKYNIHEWHNLLSWTPSRVSTLPGLHVDCQSTPRVWHLHQFLCYQYRANLRLHHCVVSSHFSLSMTLFINHELMAHIKHTRFLYTELHTEFCWQLKSLLANSDVCLRFTNQWHRFYK